MRNPDSNYALDSTIASQMMQTPELYKKTAIEKALKVNKPIDELMVDIFGDELKTKEPETYQKHK